MKILHLSVKKEWFKKILSKEKSEDFREIKTFWNIRLVDEQFKFMEQKHLYFGLDGNGSAHVVWGMAIHIGFEYYDLIKIVNGYGEDKPTIIAKFDGTRITKRGEKTDLGIGCFFAIKIGEFIEVKNVSNV